MYWLQTPLPTPIFFSLLTLSLLPLFSLFHTISVDSLTADRNALTFFFLRQMCQCPIMMKGDIPQNSRRREAPLKGHRKQEVTKDELCMSLTVTVEET